ncbi:MAG: group II intron reverse transcriptase/maturase [Streptosporangiaceae bacterium]
MREVARKDKDARFTALLHHVTPELLDRSFRSLKKDAAPGADGVRWRDYERGAPVRLISLWERAQQGRYRAVPSRRVYIPKADGRQRPLGIAALEDKVLQRAVTEVLGAVYEADFKGFSYGFRPKRSQHDALDALTVGLSRRVNWVLDADIRGFFDHLDREWLMKFLRHRIADERILRLVTKWLNAGVLEDGQWSDSGEGTPQGGSLSPMLANVYLHYVLDLWTDWWRKTHARGNVIICRFADDFVVGFEDQGDAERFLGELRGRLAKFALELHPEKTRLIEFGPHAARRRKARGEGKPETFTFLGFRHIARVTRGRFWIQRTTDKKKMTAKLKSVKAELMRKRHLPVPEQGKWLASVIAGHQAYYAVPGNAKAVGAFRWRVIRHWRHALGRRSQKGRVTWDRMLRYVDRYLPPTRTTHPWPDKRFAARYS